MRYGYGEFSLGGSFRSRRPEADFEDQFLTKPSTDWSGTRGVKPSFGRVYQAPAWKLEEPDPADREVLISRSGSTGYRGGRPFFSGDGPMRWDMGPVKYEGPQIGGIVLGLAFVTLLFRGVGYYGR